MCCRPVRAVARNVVVVLSVTVTPSPGEPNCVAVPEPTGAPVQPDVL